MIRNDEVTLTCLSALYTLVTLRGTDMDLAAIRHLAADCGYELADLQQHNRRELIPKGETP